MKFASTAIALAMIFSALPGYADDAKAPESITVAVVGTLHTGIVAIGGESTGTTISSKGVTWELDFANNAALRAAAEKLTGQQVAVEGSFERREGVEIKERWIVTVTSLRAAKEKTSAKAAAAAPLQATPGKESTSVAFREEGTSTIIDIQCRTGIGSAKIRRVADKWPAPLVARLHLRGLESFTVANGPLAVNWSVLARDMGNPLMSLRRGNEETSLDKTSPYYTLAQAVEGDKQSPHGGLYFEVPLPAKILEGNPQEIALSWIDFFR